MNDLIFEKPSLASLPNRMGWAFFTGFCWAMWIYLWMPLLTFAAWISGFYAYGTYVNGYTDQSLIEFARLLLIYTGVIFVMGGSLLLWARVEFLRFHNVNRRSPPVAVTALEISTYADLPMPQVLAWTNARRVVAQHDIHGKLVADENERIAA